MMSVTAKQNKLLVLPLQSILADCKFSPEVLSQCGRSPDAAAAIAALYDSGLLVEASRLAAHALPKREAVWWACMCAASNAPADIAAADAQARSLAESWVRDKSDETRRAAMKSAKLAGFQSPEAWAGVAAFWSGDSISPADAPPVPPPAHLTGVAVAGSVTLASVRGKPGRQKQRLARFLDAMQDIATGGAGRLAPEAE
jgi:hypothetical protein